MNRIDHVLIRTTNLKKAISDFQEMGFTVCLGAKAHKAYNAMIYFEDESFIELVDVSRFPYIMQLLAKTHFMDFISGFFNRICSYSVSSENILDFACYSDNIIATHKKLKNEFKVSRIFSLKRHNEQLQTIHWRLFSPQNLNLPFIMSGYHPYKYVSKTVLLHTNQTKGIKRIDVGFSENENQIEVNLLKMFSPNQVLVEPNQIRVILRQSEIRYQKAHKNAVSRITLSNTIVSNKIQTLFAQYSLTID
ncbi:glyoxalase-like protein [Arcicella aurantiaca]|uniref:Glyoxalase-like protein n=1 Tax=Arcicella aurantiaca TaxID=591202 RepID=A0A316DU18_9BACT|nr:VOC family protein [Arcicella aurantiaca]PWK20063.1 glyoxalase-like protein [Arcicella aurantiaca]